VVISNSHARSCRYSNGDGKMSSASVSIPFVDNPDVVFRVVWYVIAASPGVFLKRYSEPESQEFTGSAEFTNKKDDSTYEVAISIDEGDSNIMIEISGDDQTKVEKYMKDISDEVNESLDKYRILGTEQKGRVRRALVAKTCWDRLIHLILKKHPLTEVYYQVAHGREMMIKATEGESIHPITLNTSGWLAKIEKLPREEPLPADLATALAKKSVEWKQETIDVIKRYI
jgi:hypothetical protein